MKVFVWAALSAALMSHAVAATYEGTQCGGLEKLVNQPQIKGIALHKLVCLQGDKTKATTLHLPIYRTLDLHYGTGKPLAHLRVGYGESGDMGFKMLDGTGQRQREMHNMLKTNAADGNADSVAQLKDWEAHNRDVDWGNSQNASVIFRDGVADVTGVLKIGQNLYFMMNFPASSLDDAVNTAQQIYSRIPFDQIAAGRGLAPLGVVGALDQNGVRHPGD